MAKTGDTTDAPASAPVAKKKLSLKDLPDLLTIKEVSELLRVSPLTLKRWGKRGKLAAIRINSRGDRRYKKEAVLWILGMTAE
jgi:excisionase family DNA binding protein